jgi:hypothetical protein
VIGILEFKTFLAGMGYPTNKITRTGMSMGKTLYPRAYMGNSMGRIFFDGYGCGMVLLDEYVPVAIPIVGLCIILEPISGASRDLTCP